MLITLFIQVEYRWDCNLEFRGGGHRFRKAYHDLVNPKDCLVNLKDDLKNPRDGLKNGEVVD